MFGMPDRPSALLARTGRNHEPQEDKFFIASLFLGDSRSDKNYAKQITPTNYLNERHRFFLSRFSRRTREVVNFSGAEKKVIVEMRILVAEVP